MKIAFTMFKVWLNTKPSAMRKAVIKMPKREPISRNTVAGNYKKALIKTESLIM